MEIIVDDRERAVIIYLEKLINTRVDRITVGDYAFAYKGKVIVIVERKSLPDLASSIKDGRMENNIKLLEAQKNHGCQILYIVEGPAYPSLERKIGRMSYKCLQGKLDSLLFRHNIKIIWTRDAEHTARRLSGLYQTFTKMAKEGVFGSFDEIKGGDDKHNINEVIKIKHKVNLNQVHLQMLNKITGVSYKTAIAALQYYTIQQLLTGQTEEKICYNLTYIDSGFKLGTRGTKLHNMCSRLIHLDNLQKKILSCISGITENTATKILNEIKFDDIVLLKFPTGKIENINKTEKRRIGKMLENRIALTFSLPIQTHSDSFTEHDMIKDIE